VISDDVEERLVALLGDPSTCPHGNPIPGSANAVPREHYTRLSEMVAGETIRLERITEDVELDMASLAYLDQHGFVPGATAQIMARTPDGTLVLEVGDTTVAFGPELSRRLYVAVV
jgi:DtxR family Mn-dependent transcriptional regulator